MKSVMFFNEKENTTEVNMYVEDRTTLYTFEVEHKLDFKLVLFSTNVMDKYILGFLQIIFDTNEQYEEWSDIRRLRANTTLHTIKMIPQDYNVVEVNPEYVEQFKTILDGKATINYDTHLHGVANYNIFIDILHCNDILVYSIIYNKPYKLYFEYKQEDNMELLMTILENDLISIVNAMKFSTNIKSCFNVNIRTNKEENKLVLDHLIEKINKRYDKSIFIDDIYIKPTNCLSMTLDKHLRELDLGLTNLYRVKNDVEFNLLYNLIKASITNDVDVELLTNLNKGLSLFQKTKYGSCIRRLQNTKEMQMLNV